jgi:hypothetical protein
VIAETLSPSAPVALVRSLCCQRIIGGGVNFDFKGGCFKAMLKGHEFLRPLGFVDIRCEDAGHRQTHVSAEVPMHLFRNAVVGLAVLLSLPLPARASTCHRQPLLHQLRDVATIDRLEKAWTFAYLRGDTDLEKCILSPDFTEILRTGEVKVLKDELRFADENKGKDLKIPESPKATILLHGAVAVAYGTSTSKSADGTMREVRYADYYVWDGSLWHAFFAQQTQVPKGTP